MKASLFYLPTVGNRAEIEAGMAGLRPDLYQRMLREVSEQVRLADDLGYDSVSFTEHHFHIEGFELSCNPVMLDLYFAMQTKRIRVGQLGIVLPAANPIRVAEDIAILDQMTGGRACAGFARGYQRRWVDVMAQQTHGIHGALPHQHDEIDAANRAAFEECSDHQESLDRADARLPGQILEDPGREARRGRSNNLEMGRRGRGRHPQSGRGRAEAGAAAASAGLPALRQLGAEHPLVRPGGGDRDPAGDAPGARGMAVRPLCRGLRPAQGSRMGILRDTIIADSDDEAIALWKNSGIFSGSAWFEPFGFRKGVMDPVTGAAPTLEQSLDNGYALVGTVDTVTRSLEKIRRRLPLDWLFCYTYNSLVPHAVLMKSIERLWTEVLPRLA